MSNYCNNTVCHMCCFSFSLNLVFYHLIGSLNHFIRILSGYREIYNIYQKDLPLLYLRMWILPLLMITSKSDICK